MVGPQTRRKWKMCLVFYTRPSRRETDSFTDKHTILSLCVSRAHTHKYTHDLSSSLDQTHDYICCLCLRGWRERRASFAKVSTLDRLRWVINGWSGIGGGAEETISAMLISPPLLHPPSIPHIAVLSLWSSMVFLQSITVSLPPFPLTGPVHSPLSLCTSHNLHLIAICVNITS